MLTQTLTFVGIALVILAIIEAVHILVNERHTKLVTFRNEMRDALDAEFLTIRNPSAEDRRIYETERNLINRFQL